MNFTRVLQLSSRSLRRPTSLASRSCRRLSTTTSGSPSPQPWFVDPSDITPSKPSESLPQQPQQLATQNTQQLVPSPPLPKELSPSTPLARLHSKLTASPFLEPGTLLVTRPLPTEPGPPLPASAPKGRRKRGRSYVGEGLGGEEVEGALWQWVLIAEVKEGTENRGAIESVVRQVRQSLLKEDPPVALPPRRREIRDGWAMIDAGDFAVHVVSKTARAKFFPAEKRAWSLT